MSQMYPSTSHQLVAAGFRRARKKFPTNFGQLNWPINYARKDSSKSEPFSSTITMSVCKNCEERFSCNGEIRNSRSSNVWPRLGKRCDPRSTRSMRENATSSIQRNSNEPEIKTSAKARSVCPCRRNICKSWKKQNFVVSFGETNERSQDRRISGGDARDETISRKTCPDRLTNDCPTIENKMRRNFNYRDTSKTTRKRRNNTCEKKIRRKSDSSVGSDTSENDTSENSEKIQDLDLLYDLQNKSKNTVSFYSTPRLVTQNVSLKAKPEFPSNLNEWETNTNSFESRIDGSRGDRRTERVSKNSDCANISNGQLRGEPAREEHRNLLKTERCLRDSSISQDEKPISVELRSSSSGGTNRLCKDCSLVECSRNSSSLVSSLRGAAVYERKDEHEDRVFHDQELCAIKHKDSMAILVEKFKSKKIRSSDDESTIYKDEDSSENESTINLMNKKKNSKNFRASSTKEEDKPSWTKSRKPKSILRPRKFSGASKSRARNSGHRYSTKEI